MICWTGYCSLLVSLQDGRVVYHRSRPLCLFPLTHTFLSPIFLSLSPHPLILSLFLCIPVFPSLLPYPPFLYLGKQDNSWPNDRPDCCTSIFRELHSSALFYLLSATLLAFFLVEMSWGNSDINICKWYCLRLIESTLLHIEYHT